MPELTPEIVTRDAVPTAVVRATVPMDEIKDFYDGTYPKVAGHLASQGVAPGEAFGLYTAMREDSMDLEVGFTTQGDFEPGDGVVGSELPAGECARATHVGAYDGLGESWRSMERWISEQGHQPGESMFEVYVDDPMTTEESELRTELYWPITR